MKMKNKKPIIGIIGGAGKLGNWFKIFFEKNNLVVLISDKKTKLSNEELAKKADIVIVSVPVEETIQVIKKVIKYVRKDALLADFTSVKTETLREMAKSSSGVLGMHPLFGPLVPDLQNQTIVFCKNKNNKWIVFLRKLFLKNGANIVEITAKEHDRQMSLIQALLHFNNLLYAQSLVKNKFKSVPGFLTPVFKLQSLVLGRILAQNSHLYASIEMENPFFKEVVDKYCKDAIELKKIIKEKKYKAFEKKFKESQSFFANFTKLAEKKTSEVLKLIEKQPVKIGTPKKISLKKGKVGFLGPEGTFSWQAANKLFKNPARLTPYPTIKEIFNAVSNEEVSFGVIPIENTIGGLVVETIQSFMDVSVFAVGSFKIPIRHCLASRSRNLKEIQIIKSHPQAIVQCKNWLDEKIPWAIKETAASTIAPVIEDFSKNTGFIMLKEAAKKFNLNILADNIIDNKENFTRFFVILNHLNKNISQKLQSKNTLLFLSVYDRPGILRDILSVFADRKINLTALHSISTVSSPWDYMFFLELEKSYFSRGMKSILKELENFSPFIKVIGTV